MKALLCDLGGTNCRIGYAVDGRVVVQSIRRFENARFPIFLDLLNHYLGGDNECVPSAILIALAAPVEGNTIVLTNLDWTIDRSEIVRSTGSKNVHFINDFEALGHALAHPQDLTTMTLREGVSVEQEQRLVRRRSARE